MTTSVGNTVYPSQSLEWLNRLIGFDTVSRHSNMALINDVQAYCQSLGLKPILTFNQDKNKANLFVTVPAGKGLNNCSGENNDVEDSDVINSGVINSGIKNDSVDNDNEDNDSHAIISGGIVLSGHTDVVPVDGQNWSSDPFKAVIRDNKLYGRGACDMKGFIACTLSILPKAVALSRQAKLKKPLHIALSFDEEVGCLGAPLMIDDLKQRGIHPDYCIVGEPSSMNMVIAHKGISVFKCSVHGKSVHSSLTPQGVNAISYAARLIGFIDELAGKLANSGQLDDEFDVPFSTLSVGTIQGGTATNIVPNLCEFTFDYRNLPFMGTEHILPAIQQKIEELNAQMQHIDANTGIEIQQLEDVPAMTDSDSDALQALIAGLVESSVRHKVAYATEGGQFTNAGIPTVICGPGSIERAHKADEYVELEQLAMCDRFLDQLLSSLTA